MVTVLYRQRHGYDVAIHITEHFPAHVHVMRGDKEVQLYLSDWGIMENYGFNNREIRRIRKLLQENRALILETWIRLHGSLDG